MPGTVITESDSFPTTLTSPNAGESASAVTLLSEFLQGAANRTRYLYNRLVVFVSGGSLTPSGNVTIATPTTKSISINDLSTASDADGGQVVASGTGGLVVPNGDLVANQALHVGTNGTFGGSVSALGRVRAPKGVVSGAVTAGTHLFPLSTTDHVYGTVAPASTTTWQISTNVGVGAGETIRFVNFGPGSAVVKDNLGSTLATLIGATAGALFGVTVAYDGASFVIIDQNLHP